MKLLILFLGPLRYTILASVNLTGAQTPGPVPVVVPPFVSTGSNLGRQVADQVAARIDEMPGYVVADWETIVDTLPLTTDWSEERRTNPGCGPAMRVAAAEMGVDLILCGMVDAIRSGGFDARAIVLTAGGQDWLPGAAVEDPVSAAEHIAIRFEEWTRGVRWPEICVPACFPSLADSTSPPE